MSIFGNKKTFFSDYGDFGLILDTPGDSKNCNKSQNIGFGPRLERVYALDAILEAILEWFLEILDGIWKDFGGFLRGFREILVGRVLGDINND